MDENKLKFGVGVLVISSIGVGIILTFLFGATPRLFNNDYTLLVEFPSAEGIGPNTRVVRDGVQIGRVADIKLKEDKGVLVTLAMQADQRLTRRYIPQIGSGNFVTGDASLEFVVARDEDFPDNLRDDEEYKMANFIDGDFVSYGKKATNLFDMQDDLKSSFQSIQRAGDSVNEASNRIGNLAVEVGKFIGVDKEDGSEDETDDQVQAGQAQRLSELSQLGDQAAKTLEQLQKTLNNVDAIIGDAQTQRDVKASVAKFPALLDEAKFTLDSTKKTIDNFGRVGDQFERVGVIVEDTAKSAKVTVEGAQGVVENAEKTFANLEELTAPLAQRGDQLAMQVTQTLDSLNGALREVQQFGNTLNQSNGTVKRLLEDDEMYYQVRRTIENIEMATARIRPIIDDVRVFSDKIARDPRQLGVRGALTKQPNGLGLK